VFVHPHPAEAERRLGEQDRLVFGLGASDGPLEQRA